MPLLGRASVAALGATLLAVGCVSAAPVAVAEEPALGGCVQPGPVLRYLVVFDPGTADEDADRQITAACGGTVVYYPEIAVAVATSPDPGFGDHLGRDRAYSAQAEIDQDQRKARRNRVDETMPPAVTPLSAETDRRGEQWDMDLIKAPQAHRITEGDPRVVVGVLDSGVDPHHPDLQRALDPALSAGCLTGRADTAATAWEPTSSPHGTHVAGIIAAADDGKGITGVAPSVRIASVKVVNDEGHIYPEYAVCGYMWAAEHGMTVTNSSFVVDPWEYGCPGHGGQSVVTEAMRRAVAYATARGALNIAALTNRGSDLTHAGIDSPTPEGGSAQSTEASDDCAILPAQLPGVIAVSSVGADQVKAGYSSYGLGAVDVTAPGGDTRQHPKRNDQSAADEQPCVLSTVPNGYGYYCGTSMAAPHATGVAALLASVHPDSTPAQLTGLLDQQAQPVQCPDDYDLNNTGAQDAYCSGYVSYNGFYGHGLVNALAAVDGTGAATPHP